MHVREDFTTCIEFLLKSQAYYAINVKNMSVMNMFVLSNKLFEREREGEGGRRERYDNVLFDVINILILQTSFIFSLGGFRCLP